MKLYTTQGQLDGVAEAWRSQYWSEETGWSQYNTPSYDKEEIYKQLSALTNPTVDDVARVIGNTGWTCLTCHECGREVEAVVQVGEEPDYESATTKLCLDCVRKALALLDAPQDNPDAQE